MEQILASTRHLVQNFTKNRSKNFRGAPPRTPLGLSPQTQLDTIIPVSLYVGVATQGERRVYVDATPTWNLVYSAGWHIERARLFMYCQFAS